MSGYSVGYIPGGGGASAFLSLLDVLETTFAGNDNKIVTVNESGGGLDFSDPSALGLTDNVDIIYVGKHGDDGNDGLNIESAFLTIQAAINAASAGDVVKVMDAGTYQEQITLTAGVHLDAQNAKITTAAGNALTVDGGSRVFVGNISPASGGDAVVRSAAASSAATTIVTVQEIVCTGAGNGAANADTDATLVVRSNAITVATGAAIGDPSTANGATIVDIGTIAVSGNSGYGVYNHTGYLCGRIGQIVESGTPTFTVGFGQQGSGAVTTIVLGRVGTDIAHACGANTTLNLIAGDVSGSELSTGTSNIFTNSAARIVRETGGPTSLAMAGVADGTFLKRSGATIVGADPFAAYSDVLYVGQHGDDANDGTNPNAPFETITAALAAASSGDAVIVIDGGTYAEAVTVPAGVKLWAPHATLAPVAGDVLTLIPTSSAYVHSITVPAGQVGVVLPDDAGSGATHLEFNAMTVGAGSVGVANLDANSALLTKFGTISVGAGSVGIGDGSSAVGHMHVYGQDIYLDGDSAIGIANAGTGSIVGEIEHVVDRGFATTTGVLQIAAGNIDVDICLLVADVAWNISDGVFSASINRKTGTETVSGSGVVHVLASAAAREIRETGGPTALALGAVADGEFLKRDGATIVGAAAGAPEGTAVLSTGEAGGTKFLREDGDGTCSWQVPTGGGDLQDAYDADPDITYDATGPILFTRNSIGESTDPAPVLVLRTTTAATAGGAEQFAPSLEFRNQQWSGAATKQSSVYFNPGCTDGAAANSYLVVSRNYDGGAYAELADFGRDSRAFRTLGQTLLGYNNYVEFDYNSLRIDTSSDYGTDWGSVDTIKGPPANRAVLILHQNRTDGAGTEMCGIYWDTNSASAPAGLPLSVGWVDNSNVTQMVFGVSGHGIVLGKAQAAASPPTAISVGDIAYFSDGDAGSPCLGVWTGAAYLRIVLGAAVSGS